MHDCRCPEHCWLQSGLMASTVETQPAGPPAPARGGARNQSVGTQDSDVFRLSLRGT